MPEKWSDEELQASVNSYVEMLNKWREKQSFTKSAYYSQLHARYGRTTKAFEYRMENISYVLALMGREWLPGLKPAKHVGAKNAAKIEKMLALAENKPFLPVAAFEATVREARAKPARAIPSGNSVPGITSTQVATYQRDAKVKAWVLQNSAGACEGCGKPAPFSGVDGTPYLETHHVRHLADGGPDTINNTIALCPNCHREIHHGINRLALVEKLYATTTRLTR